MMKKSIISIMLVVCLLSISFAGYAAEVGLRASECIRSYAVAIYAKSGCAIEASASVSCNNKASKLGFTSLKIQENRSGTWTTVKTVSSSFVNDSYSHSVTTTYTGVSGRQYRATVSLEATYNGTTETRSSTSDSVTAK